MIFDYKSSNITILVIANGGEGEGMLYVCETATTSNSIHYERVSENERESSYRKLFDRSERGIPTFPRSPFVRYLAARYVPDETRGGGDDHTYRLDSSVLPAFGTIIAIQHDIVSCFE